MVANRRGSYNPLEPAVDCANHMPTFRSAAVVLIIVAAATRAWAVNIVIDYSDDLANGNFFGTHPTAKASVEAAAADLNSFLTQSLAFTTDTNSATVNTATATFNFRYSYTSPSTN